MADIADGRAGLHHLDTLHHGLVGHINQPLRLDAYLADAKHAAGIAMPAFHNGRHVDIDHIAFQQHLVAGNAVAHHMVDGRANRLGKAAIVKRRGDAAAIRDELGAELVQFFGRHARHDKLGNIVQRFGSQAAGLAHAFEFGRAVNFNGSGLCVQN